MSINLHTSVMATFMLSVCAASAYAVGGGPDFFNIVNVDAADVLNLRAEPSVKAPVVMKLPPTTTRLQNLGCVDVLNDVVQPMGERKKGAMWCQVQINGKRGWVNGNYLVEE